MQRVNNPQIWIDGSTVNTVDADYYIVVFLKRTSDNQNFRVNVSNVSAVGGYTPCSGFWILTLGGDHPRNVFLGDEFVVDSYTLNTPNKPVYIENLADSFTLNSNICGGISNVSTNKKLIIKDGNAPPPPLPLDITPNVLNLTRGSSARTRLRVGNDSTTTQTKNITITSEHGLQLRAIPR